MVVGGAGAAGNGFPPVAAAYQFRVPPDTGVAINSVERLFWHILIELELTEGAGGNGFTVTVRLVRGPSQPLTDWLT